MTHAEAMIYAAEYVRARAKGDAFPADRAARAVLEFRNGVVFVGSKDGAALLEEFMACGKEEA